MKKNVMMRVASIMLVLVLMSSSVISGTFAKYVTDGTSTDKARVAKWGVVVTGASDMFEDTYKKHDNTFTLEDDTVISAADLMTPAGNDDVVAPGTDGKLTDFAVTGTPEVAVRVSYDVKKFELNGWEIGSGEYCPIIFTINGVNYYIGKVIGGNTVDTADKLETAIIAAIENVTADYKANTDLSVVTDDLQISWRWAFEGTDFPVADYQTDPKDTELGNRFAKGEAMGTIDLEVTCTITQID